MGRIRTALSVKFFAGMLTNDQRLFSECADIISSRLGPVDFESGIIPWGMTDYYRDELGSNLLRKFIFFKELRDPAILAKVKLITNDVETQFAIDSAAGLKRRINIDPGYLTESKVVLATTKDYSHRIYIGENIYAEVTLRYSSKQRSFMPLDYTYLDYKTAEYKNLFNKARDLLRNARKEHNEKAVS